jgi:ribonuclease HII
MHRALDQLSVRPEGILVNSRRPPRSTLIPYTTIVKGDGKMLSIAAASILAKTHRDELMCRLDEEFPQYGWRRNKGYPTPDHRAAIAAHGATPYHRHTFQLLPQPTLFDGLDTLF